MPDRKLSEQQEQDLSALMEGCRDVLLELDAELTKYKVLDNKPLNPVARSRKAWKRMNWDQEKIKGFRDRITSNITLLTAYNTSLTSKVSETIRGEVAVLDKRLEGLQQSQTRQEYQSIIDWLSPLNFSSTQIDILRRRQEGTGQWLLESQEFKDWLRGEKETLWCPGIPGAGKTVLSSIVVDYLQSNLADGDTAVAWIYCDYKQKTAQTIGNLTGSLLKQLVQKRPIISNRIKKLYTEHSIHSTRPSLSDTLQALQSEVQGFHQVLIVVDALDECEEFGVLINGLRSLPDQVNLLVTSRHLPAIEREFDGVKKLEIHATAEDVGKYVRGRIPKEYRLLQHVKKDPTLQDAIVSTIIEHAKGMFLIARLHMDSLVNKNNRRAIRNTLENLPKGLDDTYAEVMNRIAGQNIEDKELAEEVLLWISYAARPLSVLELQHALAVEEKDSKTDVDALPDEEIMISVCAGLVVIDTESSTVRLVHATTQKYFEDIRLQRFPDAQSKIAAACLTYLLFDVFSEGYCSEEILEERQKEYPLLSYAARNWGDHVRGDVKAGVKDLAEKFLADEAKLLASTQILSITTADFSSYKSRYEYKMSAMHHAAYFGLKGIMGSLLDKGDELDPEDGQGRTPLSWAARFGHKETVEYLLHKGAAASFQDHNGATPLTWAVTNDHDDIVKLLLENGAVLDVKDEGALRWAAEHGHEVIVELLLGKSADPNSKDFLFGRTALALAVRAGHKAVVRILLGSNADLYLKDVDSRTPLSYAAENGDEDTLGLLLQKGNEPDAKSIGSRTPLSWAAGSGRTGSVRLLLGNGANPDSRDSHYGRTPLSWAAAYGTEAVVKLLLDKRVNINSRDHGYGRTPLTWAAANGRENVVVSLLEKGAELEAKDHDGRTPLSWAAEQKHETIVNLLLEKGATRNSAGQKRAAEGSKHQAIPELKLET